LNVTLLAPADDAAIKLQGDFTWDPDKPPTLTGLHLNITRGQLVAVVGPTGSGKTSLMSAILGLLQGVTQDEECGCLWKGCKASGVWGSSSTFNFYLQLKDSHCLSAHTGLAEGRATGVAAVCLALSAVKADYMSLSQGFKA